MDLGSPLETKMTHGNEARGKKWFCFSLYIINHNKKIHCTFNVQWNEWVEKWAKQFFDQHLPLTCADTTWMETELFNLTSCADTKWMKRNYFNMYSVYQKYIFSHGALKSHLHFISCRYTIHRSRIMAARTVTSGKLVRLTAKLSRQCAHWIEFLYRALCVFKALAPTYGAVSFPFNPTLTIFIFTDRDAI